MSSDTKVNKGIIKKVSILGCGWFGLALAKDLVNKGYAVNGSITTPQKLQLLKENQINPFLINITAERILADDTFFKADVLFVCIPPKRNSNELYEYPDKVKAILEAAKGKTCKVILISSTSVYGDENKVVNENSQTNPDTDSGKVVLLAEQILKKYHPDDFTVIRFAGLIGPDRNPGRFFAGKTAIPNGLAPVNLIHQTDAVGLAIKLLEKEAFGKTYNACAPLHPNKKDFYTKAAKDSGLTEPEFLEEKINWKIVESINVPEFLNYRFEVRI
ncbi:NAD(P)-binding domain-containing protein [Pedobacter rhodius]|uniref:NAD(P)-binding domain-containing protein n=1 Tax=Pedobacter rhodius TaxID=3004098 RepID=A0ABT4KT66_9SPHI|nr:NAD(P)-binding domain-containing protein [Pedobacter sp. SJ11]MCZ4221980.1 NAD(P)-binding domain-containing protein [Pedobacter sp. SJ11]